ncbi:MAG: 5-formyltetrahydrofolate cyclo-ligase [Acetobacteraceae bacterium]|nr:5-formyltetrahydrofolate cyclo-ligase [Acetobacteraceae bacterium]
MISPDTHGESARAESEIIAAAKREARVLGFAARAGGDPRMGMRLAGVVLAGVSLSPGAIVAGYWPLRGEIDPRPLMLALAGRGHPLALPIAGPRGSALTFRRFRFGDVLAHGPFGTSHPSPMAEAVTPAVLLVPLVAFDSAGGRIGHGAGYYDRTLAALRQQGRVFALGIGYAAQRQPRVPVGAHDAPLDAVATEEGLVTAR